MWELGMPYPQVRLIAMKFTKIPKFFLFSLLLFILLFIILFIFILFYLV